MFAVAAGLCLTASLAACGGGDTADEATSAAASAVSSATSAVASATAKASEGATESAACQQFDELYAQINDQGAPADVNSQLESIQQTAADEGDKEAEAAAKELLANEVDSPGWNEALLQMEAVCGGERDGD